MLQVFPAVVGVGRSTSYEGGGAKSTLSLGREGMEKGGHFLPAQARDCSLRGELVTAG